MIHDPIENTATEWHLHLRAADWLEENGYEFRHEVTLNSESRADFIAVKGGVLYVVECKNNLKGKHAAKAIKQINRYRAVLCPFNPAIVVTRYGQSDERARCLCLRWDIEVVEIHFRPDVYNYNLAPFPRNV